MKITLRSPAPILRYLILAIPALLFLERMWRVRWIGDDGLINTRVVRNILAGFGPIYNIGERVEAFTSPLWIWILSLCGILGFKPETASVYLGLALSFLGMCFAILGSIKMSSQLEDNAPRFTVPVGMLVYASIPPAWDYGTSGLETGLGLAWLGGTYCFLSFLLSARSISKLRHSKSAMGYAALLGLGPLIRPELSIFCTGLFLPLIIGVFAVERRRITVRAVVVPLIRLGLFMAALPVGYQLFRMGYYAALTSNTAIAKEAFMPYWEQGWRYFDNFVLIYYLPVPFLISALFLTGSVIQSKSWVIRSALICPAVCCALYTLAVVKVGGDFMHGRFFLPGIFGGLMPVATVLPTIFGRRRIPQIVVAVLMLSLIGWSAFCISSLRMSVENQNGIGDERGWYVRRASTKNPTVIRAYKRSGLFKDAKSVRKQQKEECPKQGGGDTNACNRYVVVDRPDFGKIKSKNRRILLDASRIARSTNAVVMRDGIGIFGTAVGKRVHVVDRYGLADPIGARMRLSERGRPGHEKRFSNTWMVARFGDTTQINDKAVHAARKALRCPPLADLIDAVTEPLTFTRFWKNVSMSFDFQTLRVPVDPSEAKEFFCK